MGVWQSPLFRRDTSISSVIRFLSEPIYGVGPAALGLGVQTFKFQIQPGPSIGCERVSPGRSASISSLPPLFSYTKQISLLVAIFFPVM